jgi:signal transduction histidine kinase
MATTAVEANADPEGLRGDPFGVKAYCWVSGVLLFSSLAAVVVTGRDALDDHVGQIALWAAVAAAGDLLAVRPGKGISLSMSLPVTLAAAMLLPPAEACLIGFLGCLDISELKGESTISRVVFNRCQVGFSVMAASFVFHASPGSLDQWPTVLIWSLLALSADAACNILLIIPAISLRDRVSPRVSLIRMFGPVPTESLPLYCSMALVAPLLAVAYQAGGPSGLLVSMIPLALARASLIHAQQLHHAEARIESKDVALRRAIEQIAQERRDERLVVAGELHDEVLPPIFKVHLMGQVLRQDLASGRLLDLDADLPELLIATEAAQRAIREVLRDMRKSPLGPGGLRPTIELLAQQLEATSHVRLVLSLDRVGGTELAQLVVYQVAREAMANAAKYTGVAEVHVTLSEDSVSLRLVVSDNGIGFDIQAVDSAKHFGLTLMRERVEVSGGQLSVVSRLGAGTTIVAQVPKDA